MPHSTNQIHLEIPSLNAFSQFAGKLATLLQPGDVVALNGTLGAGKTTLVQYICQALGLAETASSPTFVLMNEYMSGRFPIVHVDLYRLGEERADSLSEELMAVIDEGRALILVEWACYGRFLNEVITVSVQIDTVPGKENVRSITLCANRTLDGYDFAEGFGS
jgi:tRNA threonylcarbamoyladenosine biosynthesis protein TsaE